METTMYGDQDYGSGYHFSGMDNVQQLKRRMTLDLERPAKRQRGVGGVGGQVLTSPDMHMLKLASPELERLIIQHNGMVTTPTPGGPHVVSNVFTRTVTQEQEDYARGFVDALQSLKQRDQGGTPEYASSAYSGDGYGLSDGSPVYTTLESSCGGGGVPSVPLSTAASALPGAAPPLYFPGQLEQVQVKEEPQTVPSCASSQTGSPQPPSPVDMAEQERIKLERKRLRNRIAATKCRKRKLERIARLEDRVRQIKQENSELMEVAGRLRQQVRQLKQEVLEHSQNGCQIMYTAPC